MLHIFRFSEVIDFFHHWPFKFFSTLDRSGFVPSFLLSELILMTGTCCYVASAPADSIYSSHIVVRSYAYLSAFDQHKPSKDHVINSRYTIWELIPKLRLWLLPLCVCILCKPSRLCCSHVGCDARSSDLYWLLERNVSVMLVKLVCSSILAS